MFHEIIQFFYQAVDFFLHLDRHLLYLVQQFGITTYALLFLVVFCETGLVVTPFLPGDSLLFATGALCALPGSPLHILPMMATLSIAAILGDSVNYMIGRRIGPKVFSLESRWFLKKSHLEYTKNFFEKYGAKTIVLARFVPIARTFAPFVAGVGEMSYIKFLTYNIVGGLLWVFPLTFLGYLFGNLTIIKSNFHLVVVLIIFVSILPGVWEWYQQSRKRVKAY